MTKFTSALAAIATLCLLPLPAAAVVRDKVTARVTHGDLDLASAAGRTAFDRRVRAAARHACGLPGRVEGQTDAMRCLHEMTIDAETQVAAIRAQRTVALAGNGR